MTKTRSARAQDAAACGCAQAEEHKAAAVDPQIKASNLRRLRRIEGQVRGLHRMVGSDRYCPEIMVQIAAVQEALRTVARGLMRNHLKHCATRALTRGTPQEAEATYDELMSLIFKYSR